MRLTLHFCKLLGLLLLPVLGRAEGSKQLTPNNTAGAVSDATNTRGGFLEHDSNADDGATILPTSNSFLKPSGFVRNSSTYSDDHRMYVYLKPGETVYYGVHRTTHDRTNSNQTNLTITLRYSADGKGLGTFAKTTTLERDEASLHQSLLLPNQGVINSAAEAAAGPRVSGTPAAGYNALSYTNSTGAVQYVWFEFTQANEAALDDGQRFSVYDWWDFTVKTAANEEKPGRLFSKQWAFSAGATNGYFSSTFNMFPLIPSKANPGRYFVKKFELAGIRPQNFFRFVTNSLGTNASATDFTVSRRSQVGRADYPEYLNFVNDPDPEIWPSAPEPRINIGIQAFCRDGNGSAVFTTFADEAGQFNVAINLDGVAGYQAGGRDVLIQQALNVGFNSIPWNGRDGLGNAVASNTNISFDFASSGAAVNFPVFDAEFNPDGFRIQNIRPSFVANVFDRLYWDDSNLPTADFPATLPAPDARNVRTDGQVSTDGVHRWGYARTTGGTPSPDGDGYTVNTWTYGFISFDGSRTFTYSFSCDNDQDGVNDAIDIDDDNDGITDVMESFGSTATTVNPSSFRTMTSPILYLDINYVHPILGAFRDANRDGINDLFDIDQDGVPNHFDLDSDGDGITDLVEAARQNQNNGNLTANVDYNTEMSRVNGPVGANGMPNSAETGAIGSESGNTKYRLLNTDGDAARAPASTTGPTAINYNFLDKDSDNDGILDNIEGQFSASTNYRAPRGVDTDKDGWDDAYDPDSGGTVLDNNTPDRDEDGVDDMFDLDTDNDGIPDAVEANGGKLPENMDAQGRYLAGYANDPANDVDRDGLLGVVLANTNSDTDVLPNYRDTDSDGDGMLDGLETRAFVITTTTAINLNNGRLATFADGDNDGLANSVDPNSTGGAPFVLLDSDGDKVPDYLDVDSDNDGILDALEAQPTPGNMGYRAPTNTDTDNDGIDNAFDSDAGGTAIATPVNTDTGAEPSAKFFDYRDTDSDNDNATRTSLPISRQTADWTEGFDTNKNGAAGDEIVEAARNFATRNPAKAGYYPVASSALNSLFLQDDDNDDIPNFLDPDSSFFHDDNANGLVDIYDPAFGGAPSTAPKRAATQTDADFRTFNVLAPLPVELISFEAQAADRNAVLNWATASEKNNASFQVERSVDAVTFVVAGTLQGKGTTSRRSEYAFTDKNVGAVAGTYYYRLRQVDQDGTATLSDVRVVNFTAEPTAPAVSVYPSPAAENATLNLLPLSKAIYSVEILGADGRLITRFQTQGGQEVSLSVAKYAVGTYLIRVSGQGQHYLVKLLKN